MTTTLKTAEGDMTLNPWAEARDDLQDMLAAYNLQRDFWLGDVDAPETFVLRWPKVTSGEQLRALYPEATWLRAPKERDTSIPSRALEQAIIASRPPAGDFQWATEPTPESLDTNAPREIDMVNHPPHYIFANGVEVIDLTEQLDFLRGNAVKYLARAGRKYDKELEDLRKARFYVDKAIAKLEREQA